MNNDVKIKNSRGKKKVKFLFKNVESFHFQPKYGFYGLLPIPLLIISLLYKNFRILLAVKLKKKKKNSSSSKSILFFSSYLFFLFKFILFSFPFTFYATDTPRMHAHENYDEIMLRAQSYKVVSVNWLERARDYSNIGGRNV